MAVLASSAKATVMKTDAVLTTNEYLSQWCALWKRVSPPASDARHIPIAAEDVLDLNNRAHGCRCDRWGHPCPGCVKSPHETEQNAGVFGQVTK